MVLAKITGKQRIMFHFRWSLILSFSLIACVDPAHTTDTISIEWRERRATGLIIPTTLMGKMATDSIRTLLHVHLASGANEPPVFGEYLIASDSVVFRPLIPFTPGLEYDVRFDAGSLGKVKIPAAADAPAVVAVLPSSDTVPENLLKVYIQFSKPMREGVAISHISLTDNAGDTVPDVFLDLQTELWNDDQTMLTLWLDPGRIKRGLQPNRNMGAPLLHGNAYRLTIAGMEAMDGGTMRRPFIKQYWVAGRDSLSPTPGRWTIAAPEANTLQPLGISFHETLDYALVMEAISIRDAAGKPRSGTLIIDPGETGMQFTPDVAWGQGVYTIALQPRLEDAAGNNLDRPFDAVAASGGSKTGKNFDVRFKVE